jgi:putative Holliday junction resolvase
LAAGLPQPYTYITNDEQVIEKLQKLVTDEQAEAVVLGLPRGLGGQETAQTQTVRDFGGLLKQALTVPLYWQDEALTSKQAEAELDAKGKPYQKGDVDALAACYILDDFLQTTERLPV